MVRGIRRAAAIPTRIRWPVTLSPEGSHSPPLSFLPSPNPAKGKGVGGGTARGEHGSWRERGSSSALLPFLPSKDLVEGRGRWGRRRARMPAAGATETGRMADGCAEAAINDDEGGAGSSAD
uniref:DUF834 domain-containing protein n=1 Tax=Oryza meridionalis TaxID=40149 RepID=A0A0E0EQ25_9ORYZ